MFDKLFTAIDKPVERVNMEDMILVRGVMYRVESSMYDEDSEIWSFFIRKIGDQTPHIKVMELDKSVWVRVYVQDNHALNEVILNH